MKRIFKSHLSFDNQILIPEELLLKLHIEKGEELHIIDANDAIIVIKKSDLTKYFKEN